MPDGGVLPCLELQQKGVERAIQDLGEVAGRDRVDEKVLHAAELLSRVFPHRDARDVEGRRLGRVFGNGGRLLNRSKNW